ncbi:MAG: hypothetical protein OEL76_03510 [Siculibacillus sp.]|nr:hypothetical protein [Siculibacillus sp.]
MRSALAPVARPPLREAIAALFSDPREKAFFFALEGVLLPGHDALDAEADGEIATLLLADLARAVDGAVAVLSDAPLAEVDRMLAPLRPAGCGARGLELRLEAAGPCVGRRIAADLDPVRRLLAASAVLPKDLEVVDEGLALALHHRGERGHAAAAKSFVAEAIALAPAVFRGDLGGEVTRVTFAGASMGGAICRIMDSGRFADRVPVVFTVAGRNPDCLSVANFFGGTSVAVGSSPDGGADIALDGPLDVRWVIRDFLAHLEVEAAIDAGGRR